MKTLVSFFSKGCLALITSLLVAVALPASAGLIQSIDFSGSVDTSLPAGAGKWNIDRYAPNGFATSGGTLVQTISAADSATSRPAGYSSTFYNTQGRIFELVPGVTSMYIDLFVDSAWASTGNRMAGFWGVGYDNTDTLTSYPILEFASNSPGARFQGWDDTNGWDSLGLPSGFTYNTWHTLGIKLNGLSWDYLVDGNILGSVSALGSTHLGNVILQGYNNYSSNTAGSYDIKWDNFRAYDNNPVPVPATAALMLPFLLFILRNKKKQGGADTSFNPTPA